MKKYTFIITLILLTSNLFAVETWDILNKSMAESWSAGGWSFSKGSGSIPAGYTNAVTQETGYVNITKNYAHYNNRYGFIISSALSIQENTAYTFEVKVRANAINKELYPDVPKPTTAVEGGFEANQIAIQINNKIMSIYLASGDSNNGYATPQTTSGTGVDPSVSEKYTMNTAEWHVYRFILKANRLTYDVYLDDIKTPIFKDVLAITKTGSNTPKFGGESWQRCNMDIEYVKMGTGDFNPDTQPKITSIVLSSDSHVANHERTVSVTANTDLIPTGEKLLLSLVDENGTVVVSPIEITTGSDKSAKANLVIPATVPIGKYAVKIASPNGKIGNEELESQSVQYVVVDVSPIDTKILPQVKPVGFVREIEDYKYIGPSKEFIFPSIIDAKKYTTDGKFLNGQDTLARYYLYYAPHENPGGMYLSTAPTLDGPWTERNTVIDLAWAKKVEGNVINTAPHISACQVVWNEVHNKYFMYFHGPNSTSHYAYSDNLVDWTFGASVINSKQFSPIGEEASYAKVFKHEIPGLENKYVMLLMNQEGQIRKVYWAHSKDGVTWTPVSKPLISPNLDYKKIPGTNIKPSYSGSMGSNVSGPFLMEKNGRYFVFCHGSSGNMLVVEVGENFDMEVHWGEYLKAADVVIDTDVNGKPIAVPRAAAPDFIQDDNGKWYMFFEAGSRLGANVGYAKEEKNPNSIISPLSKDIQVYPSVVESGNRLTVNAENVSGLFVEIINVSGNKISDTKINNSFGEVQAPAVSGLYLVKVTTNENKVEIFKILVK